MLITADAIRTTRANARFLQEVKQAHSLLPVSGNQPRLFAALDDLDWEHTPITAATVDTARGRIETRTIRVLPAPEGVDLPGAQTDRAHRAVPHRQEKGRPGDAQL